MQGYPGQPGFQPPYPSQSFNPMTSADLTALAQQGYAQQQATLQAMQSRPPLPSSSSSGPPPTHMNMPAQHGGFPQMGGMGGMGQMPATPLVPSMGMPPGGMTAMQFAQAQSFAQQQQQTNFAQAQGAGMKVRPAAPYKPVSLITRQTHHTGFLQLQVPRVMLGTESMDVG